jgi:hypothetical protein
MFVERVFHWHRNVYDIQHILTLSPSEVRSNETLLSGYRSLTGILERDLTYEGH